jgi:hypothetical protein
MTTLFCIYSDTPTQHQPQHFNSFIAYNCFSHPAMACVGRHHKCTKHQEMHGLNRWPLQNVRTVATNCNYGANKADI